MGCFRALERTSGMAARRMSVKSEGSWQGEGKGRGGRSSPELECEQKQEATGTCMSFSLAGDDMPAGKRE